MSSLRGQLIESVEAERRETTAMPGTEAKPLPAPVTPMDMLQRALESGASIDMMERLLSLNERWEKNNARKAFDAAIAEAKAEIQPVAKNATGHNNKRYADFSAYARAIDPILSRHGLSYRFRSTQTDRINVTCILSHRDGHSEENTLSGPPDTTGSKNAIQAIGSTSTYLCRYTLIQALGLAAGEDDDGKKGGGGEDTGPISEAQRDELLALIEATRSDVAKFVAYMGVEAVAEIPASQFARAKTMLEKKRGKA